MDRIRIAFLNINCLARRDASLAEDKWYVFLDWCRSEAVDFCLLAETGINSATIFPTNTDWTFDFVPAPKPLPGFGVGLLYSTSFEGACVKAPVSLQTHRFAAWLISFDNSFLLLGSVYLPHAGRPLEERLNWVCDIFQEWNELCCKYPNAKQILAGDFNTPDWLSSESPSSGAVAASLQQCLPPSHVVLNDVFGQLRCTHLKGGILDVMLVNDANFVATFVVEQFLPISDHAPLVATIHVPRRPEMPPPKWVTSADFDPNTFSLEVQRPLSELYQWIIFQCDNDSTPPNLFYVLEVASLLFTVTILCHLFKLQSPYGRFAFRVFSPSRPRLPRAVCQHLLAVRSSRGNQAAAGRLRRKLRRVITKYKKRKWRRMVSVRHSATTGYMCLQPQPSLFKQLQKETLPWKAPARSLLIGDSCLDECESLELWASYLQSLTSWEGPVLPETLWQQRACGHAPLELVRPNQVDAAAKHAKAWITESSLHTMANDAWSSVFTWSELCEALCSMNPSAAVPQSEPIPSSLLHSPCEVFRSLVLVFVSLAWILSKCPTHWLCATVIPLHKAGKQEGVLTSYRPISILPFWHKILDRLLYQRLWPHIRKRTFPWQHGGVLGTDMAFVLFHELVFLRKKGVLPDDVQFLFIDGQSAYCRPPTLSVLDALLRIPELHNLDIRLVCELLSGLKTRACILGKFTKVWKNETGLPQGGALSGALFVLITDLLYQSLVDRRLGAIVPKLCFPCPALGYVDDLVLCLRTDEIKDALAQVKTWSSNIRMQLNIGPNKSGLFYARVLGPPLWEQVLAPVTYAYQLFSNTDTLAAWSMVMLQWTLRLLMSRRKFLKRQENSVVGAVLKLFLFHLWPNSG